MIQYGPHRWLDHLFDVKGSLISSRGNHVESTWHACQWSSCGGGILQAVEVGRSPTTASAV